MKVTEILFILLIFFGISSCAEEDEYILDVNQPYIGYWSFPEHTDSSTIYSRVSDLNTDNYGFSILDNSVFIEKKNSGWCGTPPISYAIYTGNWREMSDSILLIQTEYWGGEQEMKFHLIRIGSDEIEISVELLME